VVVASLGSAHPTVLQLRGPQQSSVEQITTTTNYGGETTLEVDLSLDFRDDAAAAAASTPAPVPTSAAVSRWQPPPTENDDDTTAEPGRRNEIVAAGLTREISRFSYCPNDNGDGNYHGYFMLLSLMIYIILLLLLLLSYLLYSYYITLTHIHCVVTFVECWLPILW